MFRYRSLKNYIYLIGYILVIIYLCVMASQNAVKSAQSSGQIIDILNKTPPYQHISSKVPNLDAVTRKLLGHFLLYSLLGLFSFLTYYSFFKNKNIALTANLVSGFIIAVLTEIIQIFAQDRGPAFQDVIINYEGFLMAQACILLIVSFYLIKFKDQMTLWKNSNFFVLTISVFFIVLYYIVSDRSLALNTCNYLFLIVLSFSFVVIGIINLAIFKNKTTSKLVVCSNPRRD